MKTIKCFVSKTNQKSDSSLGNMLHYWSFAYSMSARTNFEYKILVQKELWVELKYLDLPNTIPIANITPCNNIIDKEVYQDVINNNIQRLYEHNCWSIIDWIGSPDGVHNAFKQIKFNSSKLNSFFKNKFDDCVGVHIRRGPGVWATKEEYASLPNHVKKYYYEILKQRLKYYGTEHKSGDYIHRFIKDEYYFNVFDYILSIKGDQKFYLSVDIPVECFDYYMDKYSIVTKDNYINKFLELCKLEYGENVSLSIVNYLFDLFALSKTKFLIKSSHSSWSRSAELMGDMPAYILPVDPYFRGNLRELLERTL